MIFYWLGNISAGIAAVIDAVKLPGSVFKRLLERDGSTKEQLPGDISAGTTKLIAVLLVGVNFMIEYLCS